MSKIITRRVVLGKIETTYNTDPTPAAATDAMFVENPSWTLEQLKMNARPGPKNTLGTRAHRYGRRLVGLAFSAEVKGSGTAGTAPELGAAFQACGLSETIVASTSVTYAPTSSAIKSITLYYYQDGLLRKLTGCRGEVDFSLVAGERVMANFKFTGHDAGITDVAIVTPTYDSVVPPVYVNSAFTANAYGAVISSLKFAMGNKIDTPDDVSATDGFGEIQITQRDVNGSIDPEAVAIATHDFMSEFTGGTSMALASGAIGTTAGNIINISMPAISYRDLKDGARNEIQTLDLGFGAAESSGDDEVSIAFT